MSSFLVAGHGRYKRSATAWSPGAITTVELWLDAADAATLYQTSALATLATADGDPVGGWKDKSGKGRHLLQATSGLRPTLRTGVQNGLNAVRGDGVDDYLRYSGAVASQPCSVFCVLNDRGDSSFGIVSNTGAVRCISYFRSGVEGLALYAGSANVGSAGFVPGSSRRLYEFRVNGSSSKVFVDDIQIGSTGNPGSGSYNNGVTLFSLDDLGYPAAVDICEVVVCSTDVPSERATLIAYLKTKWATP